MNAAAVACVALALAAAGAFAGRATAEESEREWLQYFIEKPTGRPFDWADGNALFFHQLPFMTGKDFSKAVVVKTRTANTPGTYDVELQHSAVGRIKFKAVADADRERSYCVVFRNIIRACAGFAPPVKDIFNGSVIHGLSKLEAEKLAREINAT